MARRGRAGPRGKALYLRSSRDVRIHGREGGGLDRAGRFAVSEADRAGHECSRLMKLTGKDMPAFELADLSGRTWRLKNLEGRAVLINVWATWCGPCQRELPHMEKLYRKLKDRSDLQILTLTIDEDLGAVAPRSSSMVSVRICR